MQVRGGPSAVSADREVDFAAMYRRDLPVLVALASSLTGSRERGADLAQEAMVRAYRSWSSVGRLDRPGAWTRRVLINLAIDEHRRVQREDRAMARLPRGAATPAAEPRSEEFWRAVRALPERQRAAVALHYLEDMSVNDIADLMEITTGTVKTSLHHARRALAEALSTPGTNDVEAP